MYFVSLSTIIKIELNLSFIVESFDLDNLVIKFIIIKFYGFVDTLINLIYL